MVKMMIKLKLSWGELCNDTWSSKKIINYINSNLKFKNPYSNSKIS